MDTEDHVHEHRPEFFPPYRLSLAPFVNPFSGESIPAASSSTSNDIFDQPPFTEFTTLVPNGIHTHLSRPQSHAPSIGPSSRPRLHSNRAFFPSGSPTSPSYPVAHGTGPHITPGHLDQPALSSHALPVHFPSWPMYTHNSDFPGQYLMPSHTPFQNQPSRPHMHQGHPPIELTPYPPARYFSFPRHQSAPSVQYRSDMETSNSFYGHLHRPSLHASANSPPSHLGTYSTHQYVPPPYGSSGHFALPRQYPPNVLPWYYDPGSFPDIFNRSIPPQAEQRFPMNYPPPHVSRDLNMPREQSTAVESVRPSGPGPSKQSANVQTPQASASPQTATVGKPEQRSVKDELGNRQAPRIHHTHHRPPVRHRYHPNPPPNRSEWVMWVGNVPSDATYDELWQLLSQPPVISSISGSKGAVEDSGVMSIFLISRSNCAFVNYESEQHMNRAISRFNGHRLRAHDPRCPQLVCRARRKEDDLRAGVGAQRGTGVHSHFVKTILLRPIKRHMRRAKRGTPPEALTRRETTSEKETPTAEEATTSPGASTQTSSSYPSTTSSLLALHFPKRFFILKSSTHYALELGVRHGTWATQKHNEVILDEAFRTSKEVILIFSVNKSGEFYGYARMASGIFQNSPSIKWALRAESSSSTPSHSPGNVPARIASERREDPPHTSSTHSVAEASPPEEVPAASFSSGKAKGRLERRSAPPAFHREDPLRPDLPPRSSVSCGAGGCPPKPRDSSTSIPQSAPSRNSVASARSQCGDANNQGLGPHLQPVVEEAHGGSGVEEDEPPNPPIPAPSAAMQDDPEVQQHEVKWEDSFKVEWLSTAHVSFNRTRHLRNPWNHGREIKVSRDGTELEPRVGQQLVEEWPKLARETTNDHAKRTATVADNARENRSHPGRTAMNARQRRCPPVAGK